MKMLEALGALRRVAKDPNRIAEVSLRKADLMPLGRGSPRTREALRRLGPLPDVDPGALRALPEGTLGRAYVTFLDAHGLRPFRLPPDVDPELVERNLLTARYSLVHDVFHVLTGFDTSWAGELGVWGFVAAQGYARFHWVAVAMACVLYPVLAPLQVFALARNLRRGVRDGLRAKPLLFQRFEDLWAVPLDDVRRSLDVQAG